LNAQRITTSKRLVHNTFFNMLTFVVSGLIGFALVPFFLGHIGKARYGIWVLVGGIVFRYGALLNLGLNSAINRYVPVYLARNDKDGIQRVISTSLFFFLVLAMLVVAGTVVLYLNIGVWFAIEPELVRPAQRLILIIGLCFAVAMPLQQASAVLSGLQRYDLINLAMLGMLLARTGVVVVLLLRGYGLIVMGIAFGAGEIVMRLSQFSFVRRLLPQAKLSFSSANLSLLREMLVYGLNTFSYALGAVIIFKASDIIIGIFIGMEEVGQFAVAAAGVLLLSQFLQTFMAAIKPAVSDLDARDDQVRVREISFLTQKYGILLIVPAVLFFVLMGREFLSVWVGGEYEDPALIGTLSIVLAILAVGHGFRMAQFSNFLVLVGRGEHRLFGLITALMGLLCVVGSIIAVRLLKMGLVGVAWANFVPIVLISGVILPIYFNWKMRISLWESISRVVWPSMLGCLPSVGLICLWKYLAPPASWSGIFAVVIAVMMVTLICSWLFSLRPVERRRFVSVLRLGKQA